MNVIEWPGELFSTSVFLFGSVHDETSQMQVPQVTEEVAVVVLDLYPTLLSLARAYSLLVRPHSFHKFLVGAINEQTACLLIQRVFEPECIFWTPAPITVLWKKIYFWIKILRFNSAACDISKIIIKLFENALIWIQWHGRFLFIFPGLNLQGIDFFDPTWTPSNISVFTWWFVLIFVITIIIIFNVYSILI